MKSLIWKDILNLQKNFKTMGFVLVLFAITFVVAGNNSSFFMVMFGLIVSMQIVTTFSFDEMTHWSTYAMTMPFSRNDLVRAKFVLHLMLSVGSVCIAALLSVGGMYFHHTFSFDALQLILMIACSSLAMTLIFGGISILLIFKFSAERARIISMLLYVVPMMVGTAVLTEANVEQVALPLVPILCGVLAFAFVLDFGMYLLSCRVFAKKDLT